MNENKDLDKANREQNNNFLPNGTDQKPSKERSLNIQMEPITDAEHNSTVSTANQITTGTKTIEADHPHHRSDKKRWREYLLEFLMLFLAVFLGFVAENIREDYGERQREREYILGMVQNLKDDTTQLNRVIRTLTLTTEKMDSLLLLSTANYTVPDNLKALTGIAMGYLANYSAFKTNNATITQLKQSGNLRLIRKGHVADSILKYDYLNTLAETQWQQYHLIYNDYVESSEEVFDIAMLIRTLYLKNRSHSDKLPPPVTSDKQKLRLYFNKLGVNFISTKGYLRLLNNQAKYASELILFLKKEYHLDSK